MLTTMPITCPLVSTDAKPLPANANNFVCRHKHNADNFITTNVQQLHHTVLHTFICQHQLIRVQIPNTCHSSIAAAHAKPSALSSALCGYPSAASVEPPSHFPFLVFKSHCLQVCTHPFDGVCLCYDCGCTATQPGTRVGSGRYWTLASARVLRIPSIAVQVFRT